VLGQHVTDAYHNLVAEYVHPNRLSGTKEAERERLGDAYAHSDWCSPMKWCMIAGPMIAQSLMDDLLADVEDGEEDTGE
jgi:hypothetical protein